MNIKKFLVGISAGALMLGGTAITAFAISSSVVYDNIPNPQPGNVPSVGYEATSTTEWGGQMQLAGTDRNNPTVTVLMSSWACQGGNWYNQNCSTESGATFTHPITANVYNVNPDNTPGSLITTVTQTFSMPYRPSADNTNCTGGNAGKWFDGTACYNGKAFPISFNLTGTLPEKVIVSVAYNTSHYGSSPIGTASCSSTPQGCPYDSLNVGTNASPSAGIALPSVNDAYLNSSWGGAYCNGALGTGTFRLDAGCWTGFLPAIKITAQPAPVLPPTDKDQCKKDGWKVFNNPSFKNQGECVSFVEKHQKDDDEDEDEEEHDGDHNKNQENGDHHEDEHESDHNDD